MSIPNLQQFAPFQSFVNPLFWHKLSEIKLNHDRLSDAPKTIFGYYSNRCAKSCLLEVDYTAFNSEFKPPIYCHTANGTLYNKNTIEEFKETDKNALLALEGQKLLEDFKTGYVIENPSCLARFFILSFADIKCHNYYYWFGFPCLLTPNFISEKSICKLNDNAELKSFIECILKTLPWVQQNFFVIKPNDTENFYSLKNIFDDNEFTPEELTEFYYCFGDPSEYEQPSWIMRTYAAFVFYKCPALVGKFINFLGLRLDSSGNSGNSLIWSVTQTETVDLHNKSIIKFVGWESNRNNKMTPRMVSMKETMDQPILLENSVNLNLKLMKWRLVPELNLDVIFRTKCLLFGAGTLGCAVARNLLGWGFKNITFLDSGKVHYANPVRQCLYTFEDAAAEVNMKAPTAAKRVKDINPNTISDGHVIQIPMPGHTIGESLFNQTEGDLNKIIDLIKAHDVIFLLTDSRESRWLPTLLGCSFNKIVINAALGFDSYLVMRHGSFKKQEEKSSDAAPLLVNGLKCIKGNDLGCYFCNDVTAPGNSMKERSLDQQCTVTRPGVSNIASSYAVELLVSILQHPERELAPAYYSNSGKNDSNIQIPEGLLGIIPHSIRGMLFNFDNILPATQKFSQCIACSEKVVNEFRNYGNEFLFKAFETAKYLEDLTGISSYKDLNSEIIDFDDAEFDVDDV